jgi:hypothetical protein
VPHTSGTIPEDKAVIAIEIHADESTASQRKEHETATKVFTDELAYF